MWVETGHMQSSTSRSSLCWHRRLLLRAGPHSPLPTDRSRGTGFNGAECVASHFKNLITNKLDDALKMQHRFAVANIPRSNGSLELMMIEIVRTLKAVLQEERRDLRQWFDLVPADNGV